MVPGDVVIILILFTEYGVHLLTTFLLIFGMDSKVVESPCYAYMFEFIVYRGKATSTTV